VASYDLQKMGAWKSAEMVRRYGHLASAQMARHAAVIEVLMHVKNSSKGREARTTMGTKKGVTITRNAFI
jgi:hypothetical protein